MRLLSAAIVYFGIVFVAGFALGVVRVLWLVPRLGTRNAELVEMPCMLLASYLAAGFVCQYFRVRSWSAGLRLGLLALLLMVGCEILLALGLRGLTLADYILGRDPLAGAAYLLALVLFALMPLLRRQRR